MNDIVNDSYDLFFQVLIQVDQEIRKHNFYSHDPYDILGSKPVIFLRSRKKNPLETITRKRASTNDKLVRIFLAPLYQTTLGTSLYRILLKIPKKVHPKSIGLVLQGYCYLYQLTKEDRYLQQAKDCAKWLIENTDNHKFGKYCWGIPWVWPMGRDVCVPAYGPQSTLSAVIGLGFVDLFNITRDNEYLDVAISTCQFFLENLYIDKLDKDYWAFSYTPYDKSHVLNVDLHCAALLASVWSITNTDQYIDTAVNVSNFTIKHQRGDGAWHYSSQIDGDINAVDNTHTGDNLEYLSILKQIIKPFPYERAFEMGIQFYLNRMFSPNGQPYFTENEKFPVESHSCCQSIITISQLARLDSKYLKTAVKVADWTIQNMMNKAQNRMYYRWYDTGLIDKTYAIGWGDAWLVKGLAILLTAMRSSEQS